MEKYFRYDQKLDLPKNIVTRKVDDKVVVLAPEKPNWLILSAQESEIVSMLSAGATVGNCLDYLNSRHTEEALDPLRSALAQIESKQFYESVKPLNLDLGNPATRLQLYLTNKCNLRCVHCYRGADEQYQSELSGQEWIEVIRQFNTIVGPSVAAFSGGESLIRKDFFDIAKASKANGNENFLFTNGTLINENNIEKIVESIDKVQVSVDGTKPEIHDSIRGKRAFKRTMKGLNLLRNTQLEVTISYCMVPDTVEDVKNNLIGFIESLNIKNIKVGISLARKLGRWESNCGGCRDYSLGEAYSMLQETLDEIYQRGWDIPSSNRNMIKRNCTFGQRLVIDQIGDAFPCAETVYKIGNVRKDSMSRIHEKLVEAHRESDVEHTKTCMPCELKYICRGGCKTLRTKEYGSLFEQRCDEERKNFIYRKMIQGVID